MSRTKRQRLAEYAGRKIAQSRTDLDSAADVKEKLYELAQPEPNPELCEYVDSISDHSLSMFVGQVHGEARSYRMDLEDMLLRKIRDQAEEAFYQPIAEAAFIDYELIDWEKNGERPGPVTMDPDGPDGVVHLRYKLRDGGDVLAVRQATYHIQKWEWVDPELKLVGDVRID